DIGGQRQCAAAEGLDRARGLGDAVGLVVVVEDDIGAVAGEREGDAAADALSAGAGHERGVSFESHVGEDSGWRRWTWDEVESPRRPDLTPGPFPMGEGELGYGCQACRRWPKRSFWS